MQLAIRLSLLHLFQPSQWLFHQQKKFLLEVLSFFQEALSLEETVIVVCEEFCRIKNPMHSVALCLSSKLT